jgi:hypothetical protein
MPARPDELPHPLVAVQLKEFAEHAATEPKRVPDAVGVAAYHHSTGRRCSAMLNHPPQRSRLNARLIAEHQHDSRGLRVHSRQCDTQRCRTPGAEVLHGHHIGPVQRHRIAHRPSSAAQGDDELIEPGTASDVESCPEHGRIPVWQKLFGCAQSAGATGREQDTGDRPPGHAPSFPAANASRQPGPQNQ